MQKKKLPLYRAVSWVPVSYTHLNGGKQQCKPAESVISGRRWSSNRSVSYTHLLMEAVKAVFRSWDNPRAIVYRRMNDIPGDWGTAVNVQTMVFGNMRETSGTGVAFTRNPSTGEKGIYGEYLINAQGEDVVAGVRTCLLYTSIWDVSIPFLPNFTKASRSGG